jgi:S-DNA-T family DNA segregation ATPase FtsK/SpoIIIE
MVDRRIVSRFMRKQGREVNEVREGNEGREVNEVREGNEGREVNEEDEADAEREEEKKTEEKKKKDDKKEVTLVVKPPVEDDTEYIDMIKNNDLFDPTLELSGYKRPPLDLLDDKGAQTKVGDAELEKNKEKIKKTLGDYKIGIDKIIATIGPTVTLYEIVPQAGIRIASIKRLEDDIALSLAALGVRIIAPIPGKGTVGIEVPNEHPETVSMLSVMRSPKFQESKYDLPVVLGKTIANETFVFDLAKMPHLLVAGATGQGKSVGLNVILTSLLYRKHPAELKLVLVDPKKVELSLYAKIERHFLAKLPDTEEAIITDTQKVVYTLRSLCIEMDARYDLLKAAQVRNLKEYNEKFFQHTLNPLKGHRYLPFIVVIIDEFADLLMTAGREVEEPIARLAQKARAIGIHLVIATQRPTANIITGLIKANFTARIAFRVIASVDSRTILDTTGANQLIGRGDMLLSTGGEMTRIQCAFVDTPEVEKVCEYIGAQCGFEHAFYLPEYSGEENADNGAANVDLSRRDDLFNTAAHIIVQNQQGSTSLLQRKLNLGYNRAGRLMDQLEAAGIVGPFEGSKSRQVLYTDLDSLTRRLRELEDAE